MRLSWKSYVQDCVYDEWIGSQGRAREPSKFIAGHLRKLGMSHLVSRQLAADLAIKGMGVGFRVYHRDESETDQIWPFDVIPRLLCVQEWRRIEEGLKQRICALNFFLDDIYNKQAILKAGVIPKELVVASPNYLAACEGIHPPLGLWVHINGSDLIRHSDGELYVLEDNLRVPSGVSYMLENRRVTKRVFPELFENYAPMPIDDYPSVLFETLSDLTAVEHPEIVVLTPGIYNSAYFEHSYLAQQMGCELVEGSDLFVDANDRVFMKTIDGLCPVHVIYRRVDDLFLDPSVFREDSVLGVSGLVRAWAKGNVTLVNAPGSGAADDKAIFPYVPDMIRFYLDEEPKLASIPTYQCADAKERAHVLTNLENMVIKPTCSSGGHEIFLGYQASKQELKNCAERIKAHPKRFIAQPLMHLSTVPTLIHGKIEPCHVDLRPFVLSGKRIWVAPGGLTRVAMPKGSMIVNSSQGGGSKDTWVVDVEE